MKNQYLKIAICRIFFTLASGFLLITMSPGAPSAEIIKNDQEWHGEIVLSEDLIIPEGITLTIVAGTRIIIQSGKSGKSGNGEQNVPYPGIKVLGHLEVEGENDQPVVFSLAPGSTEWAGFLVQSGNLFLLSTQISGAVTAVDVREGWVKLKETLLTRNSCGVSIQGEQSGIKIENSFIVGNDIGLLVQDDAQIIIANSSIRGNLKGNWPDGKNVNSD